MLILTSDVACSSARVLVISQLQFYMVFLKLTKVRARPHSRARGYYIEAYLQRSKKSKRKRITCDLFFASKCDAENYIPEYLASYNGVGRGEENLMTKQLNNKAFARIKKMMSWTVSLEEWTDDKSLHMLLTYEDLEALIGVVKVLGFCERVVVS